jgi:hypothetical protein
MISPDSPNVWGRPVAVLELRDGSLLVSDDGGKKIWRISYAKRNRPPRNSGHTRSQRPSDRR